MQSNAGKHIPVEAREVIAEMVGAGKLVDTGRRRPDRHGDLAILWVNAECVEAEE